MDTGIAATPFGRRPMSLAMLAMQQEAATIPEGMAAGKWQVYRDLCEAKTIIGVGDRALAILAALLSFHPHEELSQEHGLVVFPSNRQLALRAHGMSEVTLRRHLAALVGGGIIVRRDSPNGKRYARRGGEGGAGEAFGFSLAPLLARAGEFAAAAERVRAEARALKLMRERITLHRRDIAKLIDAALEEGAAGDWGGLWRRFRAVVDAIPRRAALVELEPVVGALARIREDVDKLLETHMNAEFMNGNDARTERQQSDSNTNCYLESEPAFEKDRAAGEPAPSTFDLPKAYPLALVLRACPDMRDYAAGGIDSWRDFMATAAQVRGYLGISPSAYADALEAMGQESTAIVIACILQRSQHIHSAGGYLRALTEKAAGGSFSVGPMLMAALRTNETQPAMTG
ncbi:plasmid replication protein RepC [Paracoccus denitrificans]|uniref:plasmid replication protein RepC n=1 Tax=Paracoccus denitrificans TaxID=266 RepID=UPI000CEC4E05|nr:plasmid replication protein RepC [Paracoccus denitrificans]